MSQSHTADKRLIDVLREAIPFVQSLHTVAAAGMVADMRDAIDKATADTALERHAIADDGEMHSRCATCGRKLAAANGADWQPIETAPKDGTQILCFWEKSNTHGIAYYTDHVGPYGFHWVDETGFTSTPTHWMPLPAGPSLIAEQRQEVKQ